MNTEDHPTRHSLRRMHDLCDQFEQLWRDGGDPNVHQFLASLRDQWESWEPATRRQLLEELIKLDLEYRWKTENPDQSTAVITGQDTLPITAEKSDRLFLEDYVREHPELGSSDKLSLELVLEEYRVRQQWGDRPSHQEYVKRFPNHGQALQQCLVNVDSELSAEQETQQRQGTRSTAVVADLPASGRFGDYELLEEIARGGMGVVFKARQVSLNRTVAVKMILAGKLATDKDVRRFRSEAESAANLQHPHIVTIFEVGTLQGQHYFSMDYIDGQSLSQQVAEGPLPVEQAVELIRKVALAIDYAHQEGILHRDLKPHNILIDSSGQPQVTDFGLAKQIEGQSDLTGTGQILGTPSYMPPEQAGTNRSLVGPASDIYSLGAVLYELVTGRPPFQAQTPLDTLMQVLEQEPVAPRTLNSNVPTDLETIILKCLQKEMSRRYATAASLADELERYQSGEPILARPIGRLERSWRWCKRKPAFATLCALVAMLFVLLAIGGPLVAVYQTQSALEEGMLRLKAEFDYERAELNLRKAKQERERADRQTIAAEKMAKEARQNFEVAEAERKRADREAIAAKSSAEQARRNLQVAQRNGYHSDMLVAQSDWDGFYVRRLTEIIERYRDHDDLKGFEWYYWDRLLNSDRFTLRGHIGTVGCVSFSPDGKWLASAGEDLTVKVWFAATGQQALVLKGHTERIRGLSFRSDGQQLASASEDGTVKIWDVVAGKLVRTFEGHVGHVTSVSFSPDGKRVASGSIDRTVKVWDVASGEALQTLKGHAGQLRSVAYSSDGQLLASASHTGGVTVRLWDSTGTYIGGLAGRANYAQSVVFSPDGKYLAAKHFTADGLEGLIQVWDVATRQELLSLTECGGKGSMQISFSPDGKRLAGSANNGTVKVWDLVTGWEVLTLRGHTAPITGVSFSPDGSQLASASEDHTVKIWDVRKEQSVLTLQGHKGFVESVAFGPDGRQVASASRDQTVKLWDVSSQQEVSTLTGHTGFVSDVSFSPDGKALASGSWDKTAIVWKSNGAENLVLRGFKTPVKRVFFTSDSKNVVVVNSGDLKMCDALTGEQRFLLAGKLRGVKPVAVSSNGQWIATIGGQNLVTVWEWATAKQILVVKPQGKIIECASFSPDGTLLAVGSQDNVVRIWSVQSGKQVSAFLGHGRAVSSVVFSPDGKRLASGSYDGIVKVWSVEMGQEILTLRGHTGAVPSIAFSPDGKRLVSGSHDKTIKVWGELNRLETEPPTANP